MQRLRIDLFLVTAVFLLAAFVGATAEAADDQPDVVGGLSFVGEVELTVVNIDVFVRDKAGNPVTDLEKDDFRIFQDGQERLLSHFALFSEEEISDRTILLAPGMTESTPAPTVEGETLSPEPRSAMGPDLKPIHIVLFIDNENLRPMDRNRVLSQVRSFLREVMYPHVQVMVVTYQRSLKVEQHFTNDSRAVSRALRDVKRMTAGRVEMDTERKKLLKAFATARDGNTERRPGQYGGGLQADLEGRVWSFADQVALDLDHAVNAVREVMTTLSGLPGRKYLIHISSGLPMVPALDLMNEFGSIFQSRSTLPMKARFDRRRLFRGLASAANAQGVNFLTIDASGLGGTAVSSEYSQRSDPMTGAIYVNNHQEPLLYLADRTGGRAIFNTNDITDDLQDFRQDLFTYYSLGYTINSSGTDKVHRINVEVPAHPAYSVIHRGAFVERSLESKVQDRVLSGLVFDIDENPMALEVRPRAVAPASEDRWILPLEIAFPLESIALIPEGEGDEYVGRVVVFLAARDQAGDSTVQRHEQEIRIPAADYKTRRRELYVIEMQLLMEQGTFKIVIGVMDRVTRQASYLRIHREVSGG
ncbi:MAG: VWA domain-containing protein, partial [Thermoanaerobaculales bacterium]|nr:VWA domain-containing protein [Thermoanaerobaculales bacterium]